MPLDNSRGEFAFKMLLICKKCNEILIKFCYKNHVTKQVMIRYLDELVLFNSEYYMISKLNNAETFELYDFQLLVQII